LLCLPVCGNTVEGKAPDECPICGTPGSKFKQNLLGSLPALVRNPPPRSRCQRALLQWYETINRNLPGAGMPTRIVSWSRVHAPADPSGDGHSLYQRFLALLPTLKDLAACPAAEGSKPGPDWAIMPGGTSTMRQGHLPGVGRGEYPKRRRTFCASRASDLTPPGPWPARLQPAGCRP
jgi:hypothetical protein